MWHFRCHEIRAATLRGVAALLFALAGAVGPGGARASDDPAQILAAEILVIRGDLAQIAKPDLPEMHRAGFAKRIDGALGLIPWLLIVAGDTPAAEEMAGWQARWTGTDEQARRLAHDLDRLAERHPLDKSGLDIGVNRAELAEARAIHDAYCAGCHDGYGTGDPDVELASRDLFWMARDEETDVFLARLVNGVKGDESIGFVNPLTEKQIAALWKLYTYH